MSLIEIQTLNQRFEVDELNEEKNVLLHSNFFSKVKFRTV